MNGKRILVDYRIQPKTPELRHLWHLQWGLGDLLCSEPLVRGLREKHGPEAEIRYAGRAGNAAFSPSLDGEAAPDFRADEVVKLRYFTETGLEEFARLEALPSLVDHMLSYGSVEPWDRRPRLDLGQEKEHLALRLGPALRLEALPRPLVALCPDEIDWHRHWPKHRWSAISAHLRQRGATVLIVGAQPGGLAHGFDLAGQLPIRETAAAIAQCDLFLGNNSGLLHYAQAAGTPAIATFSLARPERFIHEGRLVLPVRNDSLDCLECVTRDYPTWARSGCQNPRQAACMRDLPEKAMLEALDRVFELYLPPLESFHQEGPRARAFRAELQAQQDARRRVYAQPICVMPPR